MRLTLISHSREVHAPWQHPAIRQSLQQLGAVAAEPLPELASISSVLEPRRLRNKWIARYGDRMRADPATLFLFEMRMEPRKDTPTARADLLAALEGVMHMPEMGFLLRYVVPRWWDGPARPAVFDAKKTTTKKTKMKAATTKIPSGSTAEGGGAGAGGASAETAAPATGRGEHVGYQYSEDAVALYVIDWTPSSFENLSLVQARVNQILQHVESHEVIITAQEWNVRNQVTSRVDWHVRWALLDGLNNLRLRLRLHPHAHTHPVRIYNPTFRE